MDDPVLLDQSSQPSQLAYYLEKETRSSNVGWPFIKSRKGPCPADRKSPNHLWRGLGAFQEGKKNPGFGLTKYIDTIVSRVDWET